MIDADWILQLSPKEWCKLLPTLHPHVYEDIVAVLKKDNSEGESALHRAANNPDELPYTLEFWPSERRPTAVMKKNKAGNTVLHCAATNRTSLIILLPLLLPKAELRAALKKKNNAGDNVLQCAASSPEALCLLIRFWPKSKRPAALSEENAAGKHALHIYRQEKCARRCQM